MTWDAKMERFQKNSSRGSDRHDDSVIVTRKVSRIAGCSAPRSTISPSSSQGPTRHVCRCWWPLHRPVSPRFRGKFRRRLPRRLQTPEISALSGYSPGRPFGGPFAKTLDRLAACACLCRHENNKLCLHLIFPFPFLPIIPSLTSLNYLVSLSVWPSLIERGEGPAPRR